MFHDVLAWEQHFGLWSFLQWISMRFTLEDFYIC